MEHDDVEILIRYDDVISYINEFMTINNLIPQVSRNLLTGVYHKINTNPSHNLENILINEKDVIEYLNAIDITNIPKIT